MSAISTVPGRQRPAKPALRLLPDIADRGFMPPALAIVETPPSPIRMALMLTICAFSTLVIAWAWFGRIDVIAIARGAIVPVGHVKVVQPAETGKVSLLRVADGQVVKAGDLLLQLDSREAEAQLDEATKVEVAARAEAERRKTALAFARAECWTCASPPAWQSSVTDDMRKREETVLRADMREIASTLANLRDQEGEKAAAVLQSDRSIISQQALLVTLGERVQMRNQLMQMQVGSRSGLLDATQTFREAETQLVAEQGRRDLALAGVTSLRSQRARTVEAFIADQTRKMADALRIVDEKAAERVKAQVKLDHLTLRAPVDGIIQNLTVTTPGQVVSQGQEIMRLVPSESRFQIQAYVSNDDIGFIRNGQVAAVKLDAFPFTRFGTLAAHVEHVSIDAVPVSSAEDALVDQSSADDKASRALLPTAKPSTNLVFATVLDIDGNQGKPGADQRVLRPGMTVAVEIKTGSRRIIDYLLAPLTEVEANAFHER